MNKNKLPILFYIVLCLTTQLSVAAKFQCPKSKNDKYSEDSRKVIKIIDGDTIVVEQHIRLIGVNTPETKHPKKPKEYFGKEATEFTKSTLIGKEVCLEYDNKRIDYYGRTLAYVHLLEDKLFNAELVKQGYSHAYTKYPFKYSEDFIKYEKEARQNKKGFWNKVKDLRNGTK